MRQQDLDTFHSWNHVDRMIGYRVQAGPSPSVEARYLYGADGIRVKKWVKNGGGQFESTIYVEDVFEYHSWLENGSAVIRENNHIHVMDRQSRIALSRVGDQHSADAGIPVQYYMADHLGSGTVVLDELGAWVNREEFFSYGETSFGSFRKKRYRFSGKECDEESRVYYYGARFYAPWLARWLSCEPETATASGKSRYEAFANSPEGKTDPDGHKPKIANDYRDLAALKKSVDITYTPSGRFSSASVAVSDKAKASIGTNTLSESNPGQAQLKKAAAGDWGDKLSFAASNPRAALYRNDLEKIEKLAFVKKNSSGTALGHIADEMVGHLATKPSGPTVMIGKDKVTMVDATKNMVLHVFGQAVITTLLGRGAADYAGDLHERDQPSLISGKIAKTEERQAIDNYSDMVNNLYGQDIGERVSAKLGITSSTVWNAKLTAKYLNAVEDAIAKEMGWKMTPFSAGDAEVKKFTSLLNEVQGTTPPAPTTPVTKSKP
jgi:RHS repeat-associated protein